MSTRILVPRNTEIRGKYILANSYGTILRQQPGCDHETLYFVQIDGSQDILPLKAEEFDLVREDYAVRD